MYKRRPSTEEHAPYFQKYIDKVEGKDFLAELKEQTLIKDLESLSPTEWDHRYAPGKWSVKEVVKHLSDTERVFAYRALRISRNDKTPMPGFDQDDFSANAGADSQSAAALVRELKNVRAASIDLFESLSEEAIDRVGVAGDAKTSVLALGYMILGHQNHHIQLFKESYKLWQ